MEIIDAQIHEPQPTKPVNPSLAEAWDRLPGLPSLAQFQNPA